MIYPIEKKSITIGISACLLGQKVRFDGGSKPSTFCLTQFSNHVQYQSFCPEVAIGLPIPRATIRLIKKEQMIKVAQPDGSGDVTEQLSAYGKKVAAMTEHLSGYIFCAKSPSCGMERVKVYTESGNSLSSKGVGAFAKEIMQANPLLPCEENGRLNDLAIRENFVARVYAYKHWQTLLASGLTHHKLMSFHSQYKYKLMSHDLVAYKKLGQLLASNKQDINLLAQDYISQFMAAMTKIATRKKHANTLAHIQGYFSKQLKANERQELTNSIDDYRKGLIPLIAPLTLIKHYLLHHPKDYLSQQAYLDPYPEALKLRYSY